MDSNTHQVVEIYLKDLIFVAIKKIGIMFLVGAVFAGILFCYKYISGINDANALDISNRLDDETDLQYSERVINVNRAGDYIKSIDALNNQIDNQREYVACSILMQIDPENEAVTTAQLVVTIEDDFSSGIDAALVSSYSQDLQSGEYLAGLADELGTNQGYLKELISVSFYSASSSLIVVNSDVSTGGAGTITITVIGPTTDYTDKIMDSILEEVDCKYNELNESLVAHSIVVAGRQNYYMVDRNTRDLQYSAVNQFETIQKQIDSYDKSLDELSSKIGVDDKDAIYAYFSNESYDDNQSTYSLTASVKYALIGFAIGAFLVLVWVFIDYVFGKKFANQSKFFGRFIWVKKIGVLKPTKKRSRFEAFIDKKTGDDNDLSEEKAKKILAANINNLTRGMNKVLFTGTAEISRIKELVSELGINAVIVGSIYEDPTCLESISEYDGIIVVEQRDYSDCKAVADELEFITNTNAKLLGAIII